MTAPADDRELLSRSAAGDEEAFAAFVARHAAPLRGFLRSLGAPSADTDDALQECFVSAWRGADGFQGSDSARAWLYTIARNALRRQHRRRVGEPDQFEPLDELGTSAGWGAVGGDPLTRIERRELLEKALARLSPEEREVLLLRDVQGFTTREAAEVTGLSVEAMKSRLHRGRLKLMGAVRTIEERADA